MLRKLHTNPSKFFGVDPPHVVSQQSVRWLKHGQPCLHHLHVLSTAFPGGHSLRLAFGSFCYPPSLLPSHFFPPINQCDRSSVALAWGLMAGGCRFTSHGGITLCRGRLCQSGSYWTSRAPTSTKRRSC